MGRLDYPTEKVEVADGFIDWPRLEIRKMKRGTMSFVPVCCGVCRQERYVQAPSLLCALAQKKSTGRCRGCSPLTKRERQVAAYHARGVEMLENGVTVDWASIEAPAPKVSGHEYHVDVICRCGLRRRLRIVQVQQSHGLCRRCSRPDFNGPRNPRWKGGTWLRGGYRMTHIPPDHPMIAMAEQHTPDGWGRLLEHRLVAAQALGRLLEPWEHVHHINGDGLDNRAENLRVLAPDEHATITAMQREINRLRKRVVELEALVSR